MDVAQLSSFLFVCIRPSLWTTSLQNIGSLHQTLIMNYNVQNIGSLHQTLIMKYNVQNIG